ncbi:MAG: lipopolysaccharide biosynthesis protein [Planctomycetota bacterium]
MPKIDYFDEASLRAGLAGKAVRGGVLTGVGQAVTIGFNLLSVPILARLLDKEDFGVVAMATVLSTVAAALASAGLGAAALQRRDLTHQQASNVFWINALLALVVAAAVAALAPVLGWVYGDPRVTPVVVACALPFLMSGLTGVQGSLLARAMRHDRRVVAQVSAAMLGQATSIALAYAWRGEDYAYWALAVGPVVVSATRMLLCWCFSGWVPSRFRRGAGTRELVGFGAQLTGFQLLNLLSREVDRFLIGWWWGAGQLGLYALAYRLFLAPLRAINAPVTNVAVPTLSRLTNEPERYREYYVGAASTLMLVTVPLSVFIGANADLLTPIAFGKGWEASATILRSLCVVGVVHCLSNTFGWLYVSQARTMDGLRTASIIAPIHVLSFVVGLPWQALGVATSYAAIGLFVGFPVAVWRAGACGPVRRVTLLGILGNLLVVAAAALLGSGLVRLATPDWQPALRLVASGLGLAVCVAAAAVGLARAGAAPELVAVLRRLRRRGSPVGVR